MQYSLHILATSPDYIKSCTQKFSVSYPRYGRGTIALSPYGDYTLNVTGITEGSARRTVEYKNAYNKVSLDMLHAYEEENKYFTAIHRGMTKIKDKGVYESELQKLIPEKYKRDTFDFAKPTRQDVEKDLREEYQALTFDKENSQINYSEQEFIKQHIGEMIESRQQGWQEANELFSMIEDVREQRENMRLFTEYKTLYNQKKKYICGEEDEVKDALSLAFNNVRIPFNIALSCNYKKETSQMEVKMVFEDGINIPMNKATILASGKISIKNKLMKELITDKTLSTLSIVYYISGILFMVSPNIQYLRLSAYDRTERNPLLWVEFDRSIFARIRPHSIDLYSDILGYNNVMNFKSKGDALELSVMDAETFTAKVQQIESELNASRMRTSSSITEIGDDKIAISFAEADKLSKIPMIAHEVKRAIALSKDNGMQFVILDKQYRGIVKELNT